MPISLQIQWSSKSARQDAHKRILKIGGVRCDGARWKRTQAQAIKDIQRDIYAYWVRVPGAGKVDVILAESRSGNQYIKTAADGEDPTNLLALPEEP